MEENFTEEKEVMLDLLNLEEQIIRGKQFDFLCLQNNNKITTKKSQKKPSSTQLKL